LGRHVVAGVLLLEHRERRELGIAQVPLEIGVASAFGERRLLAFLEQRGMEPLDALLEGLLAEIKAWRAIPQFADDVSVLAIEVAPTADNTFTPAST